MKRLYQITEYSSFLSGRELDGFVTLPEQTFAGLENFILFNRNADTDALELMGITVKKGVGKVITAKNYVGVITMKDGTVIEILPKLYSSEGCDAVQAKRVLLEMLKTLRAVPCKSLQTSNLKIERMSIFEIFIRMFIREVFRIVKHGLKCDYRQVEENSAFFKGKLVLSEHIRHNCVHRERFYVAFDEFDPNRPENRLIKSALLDLYRQTASARTKTDLRILLNAFDAVSPSDNYDRDFSRIKPDRSMADYHTALLWSKVFLTGKSFTAFSGSEVAQALLFPMETLFESYIATLMRQKLPSQNFHVSVQDKTYHLFSHPAKKFLLKPDIVVTRRADGAVFICDTKWKLLSQRKPNYGISQADMYQMYAYQKKYQAKSVLLLYPLCDGLTHGVIPDFKSDDGVSVKVKLIDLLDIQHSMDGIRSCIGGQDSHSNYVRQ